MKFKIDRDQLFKSLNYCQGVIEKRSTLPILSNILIEAKNSSLKITATDLDLIFINSIEDVKIEKEGSTTTSAAVRQAPLLGKLLQYTQSVIRQALPLDKPWPCCFCVSVLDVSLVVRNGPCICSVLTT